MIRTNAVTVLLIAANVLYFAAEIMLGGSEDTQTLLDMGASFLPLIAAGEYYRLFTCMFLHSGITHLMNNMVALGALGSFLEPKIGSVRLLLVYLLGGIFGSVVSVGWDWLTSDYVVSVGASGCVFALFGCVFYLFLFRRESVRELSLVRMIFALGFLLAGSFEANVDAVAHIGGLVGGFLVSAVVKQKRILN